MSDEIQFKLKAFLKKIGLPILLLTILIVPLFIGHFVNTNVKATLYAFSLSMKSVLLFVLPILIFSFIFSSLLNLKSGALRYILLLVGMIYVSNCIAIFLGFGVGKVVLPSLHINMFEPITGAVLKPMWEFDLPKWISNQYALIIGFIFGLTFSYYRVARVDRFAEKLHAIAMGFLKKIFMPLLPLFILGFVFKLEHDHLLATALTVYGPVCLIVVSTQICYMLFLYLVVSKFSIKKCYGYLRNVFPATIMGFSTLSSAATMPLLILCSEKNIESPTIPESVIPATINTHTLGSALAITLLSLTTLMAFGYPLPTFAEFAQFGFFYALAKFAVAAVPGGAIIVVTPLLETYMHFSGEMVGLIAAIYMLFDPFGTATNVTGNGCFAIAFSKLYKVE